MTLVYGLAIALGALGALMAVAAAVNSDRPAVPDALQHGTLAVLGFGLAGMSASFAGWPGGLALVAGLGGAALLVGLGMRFAIGGE